MKPEEIGESMDLSLLNRLLLKRIHGIPLDAGKLKLQADQAVLEQWLAAPGLNDNGGMIFLQGYWLALPGLVDCLLEDRDKASELDEIEMELPPGARVKKRLEGGGGWQVKWLGATLFLIPVDPKYLENELAAFHKSQSLTHPVYKFTVTPVAFGNVKGTKCLEDASLLEAMTAEYALEVPGGFVTASLLKSGNRIDAHKFKEFESKFEQYFHTIRLIRTHQPPP